LVHAVAAIDQLAAQKSGRMPRQSIWMERQYRKIVEFPGAAALNLAALRLGILM
jgi:hypothetical protein